MNCLVLEWDGEMVLIDCGILFPDASTPGVDIFAPDFSYIRQRLDKLRGVVITHGHEDHIGAIPFLAQETDLDVYCREFPGGLIANKLSEYSNTKAVTFHSMKPREVFSVGPFEFDPIPVRHSTIDSMALAIKTPVGNIVHSGDFKFDANEYKGKVVDFEPFKQWAKKGIHLLLSDSTNAPVPGKTLAEQDISESFEKILEGEKRRLIVAMFSSNIERLENLLKIAKKMNRKLALAGRGMHSYSRLAHEQSALEIPDDTLILLENVEDYPDDQVLIVATGSQAEPQSALLKMAHGTHPEIKIKKDDLVMLSSRFIPGNERAISRMISDLCRSGAEVMYEGFHKIHVSGHGFQDDLMMMLQSCRPKNFIPIHGEYRHLTKHAGLAEKAGVPRENINLVEDGQVVEVDADGVSLGERLTMRRTIIVNGRVHENDPSVFMQRAAMAKAGIVFVTLVYDAKSKQLLSRPELRFHGLIFQRGEDPETVLSEAVSAVEAVYRENIKHEDLGEMVRQGTRRYFKKKVSHKPIVIPLLIPIQNS